MTVAAAAVWAKAMAMVAKGDGDARPLLPRAAAAASSAAQLQLLWLRG